MSHNSAKVMELTGLSYRQLDYWARKGWLNPVITDRERSWPKLQVQKAQIMASLVKIGLHTPDAARISGRVMHVVQQAHQEGKPAKRVLVHMGGGIDIRVEVP